MVYWKSYVDNVRIRKQLTHIPQVWDTTFLTYEIQMFLHIFVDIPCTLSVCIARRGCQCVAAHRWRVNQSDIDEVGCITCRYTAHPRFWSNALGYSVQRAMTKLELCSGFELTNDTTCLRFTGELGCPSYALWGKTPAKNRCSLYCTYMTFSFLWYVIWRELKMIVLFLVLHHSKIVHFSQTHNKRMQISCIMPMMSLCVWQHEVSTGFEWTAATKPPPTPPPHPTPPPPHPPPTPVSQLYNLKGGNLSLLDCLYKWYVLLG